MATQQVMDQADIRRRIDTLAEAIRARDIDTLMSLYAPDIVSFDAGPLLRQTGAEQKRKNWMQVFAMEPLGYEIRDLAITLADDVAFGHSLNRISGTLKNGKSFPWVRCTVCFRKIDGNWLIVHDHVSVPLDPASGKALLTTDLNP